MDLKNLLRTYVYLSDPRVKQVTIKFSAVLIALGAVAAITAAAILNGSDDEDLSLAALERTCMPEADFEAWQDEHPEVEVVSTEAGAPGEICVTYRAQA